MLVLRDDIKEKVFITLAKGRGKAVFDPKKVSQEEYEEYRMMGFDIFREETIYEAAERMVMAYINASK